ncbi:hypothetical protein BTUL_0016g00380 [Botrytis tulipae]|uniref:N-acetyltransferase domain-containing protein n=1 Tax=Botrytis tulipae TaxID=87230 RepID=A0A4Z1EZ76_9HELO|nr:hypothetical protein BTUL_0016g00380 [Botrytis tulipae]
MALQLSEITNAADFAEVVKVEHRAYATPANSLWEVLKGTNIDECAERQWAWHISTPNSHWLTVKGGNKTITDADHTSECRPTEDNFFETFFGGRPSVMNRPHLLLNYCFVDPEHRRKGAGSLMMQWGCKLADEKGLEAFVESTDDGRELYKAHGLVTVRPFFLEVPPATEGDEEEFAKLKEAIASKPYRVWLMWRPKGGKFEEGKTMYSWEN